MSPMVSGQWRECEGKLRFWEGSPINVFGATPLTLESVHVAQVDLVNRERAHVACENKLATVEQDLLLDT